MAFDAVRKRCPFCNEVWQAITRVEEAYFFTHYCWEKECYVGWQADNVPARIPNEYIYQNPPV